MIESWYVCRSRYMQSGAQTLWENRVPPVCTDPHVVCTFAMLIHKWRCPGTPMLSCAYKNIREPGKHNLLALGTNCFFKPLL